MSINLSALMKQRYDTAANWTAQNPTLLGGEIGIESDTKKWKVGTGATAWTSLAYAIGGTYPIVNADIAAGAEIAVSKLADGSARQLLQTDAAGTGVEWTSDVSIPGVLAVTAGTAALPGIAVSGDTNTGIYSPGADQLAIATGGTGRVFVTSTGVGIGTSLISGKLNILQESSSNTTPAIRITGSAGDPTNYYLDVVPILSGSTVDYRFDLKSISTNTALLYLSGAGRVGIGTTSLGGTVNIKAAASTAPLIVQGPSTEFARIDSSGRVLVGTSSALTGADSQYAKLTVQGNTAGATAPGDINLAIGQSTASVAVNNRLGFITFADSQAGQYAQIGGFVDGTPGTNDYPGRLVFSTTADGAASPTERMRIGQDGVVRLTGSSLIFYGGGSGCGDINFNNGSGANYYSIRTNTTGFYIANTDFSKYALLSDQTFTSWIFGSDARIKENIIDCEYGIETIKRIKARRFNFIGSDHPAVGFIAQELKDVIPEAVSGSEVPFEETDSPAERVAKTMGIAKDNLFPVLVKSLQQAIELIETQGASIAELETRLSALEGA